MKLHTINPKEHEVHEARSLTVRTYIGGNIGIEVPYYTDAVRNVALELQPAEALELAAKLVSTVAHYMPRTMTLGEVIEEQNRRK